MEKPTKKERKERIKAQNAERAKTEREMSKPLTPEQVAAIETIARGLIGLFVASLPKRDEFPSEIDVEN